jgi:regulator of protease activity HflC (stomatin/prohibitin superfamily)
MKAGSNPATSSRQRNRRASATEEQLCGKVQKVLPLFHGGFLPRTFIFTNKKGTTMNTQILILITIAVVVIGALFIKALEIRRAFLVPQGFVGLLYHKGKFVELLNPGRHIRWGRFYGQNLIDLRKTSLAVAGQEVLTADNVALKLSLSVTYQVTDPAMAVNESQNWLTQFYTDVQLAARAVVNGVAVEALINQRFEIGAQLLARVQPQAAQVGVTVLAVEVKDVMFPADLKRAFADVLKAKQEGQVALERARGESAALRNLANAARVLDGNPALMNLRLIQSLATAQNAGHTLVVGVPGGFVPLNKAERTAPEKAGES